MSKERECRERKRTRVRDEKERRDRQIVKRYERGEGR